MCLFDIIYKKELENETANDDGSGKFGCFIPYDKSNNMSRDSKQSKRD